MKEIRSFGSGLVVVALAVSPLLLVGCGGCTTDRAAVEGARAGADDAPEDAFQEVPPNPLYDLFAAVDELLAAEDREGATRRMLAAMDDAQYAEHRPELFTTLIRFLLFTDQVELAQTRFLNIIRTEPELAMPGFDLIYGHYIRGGDPAATLDWARTLLLQPLTEPMIRPAQEWLLLALAEAGEHEEMLDRMAAFAREQPAGKTAPLLHRAAQALQKREQFEALDALLDVVAENPGPADGPLVQALQVQRLQGAAGQGRWDRVQDGFSDAMAVLPDGTLQGLLSNLVGAARRAGQTDVVNRLSETVLRTAPAEGYPNARATAARDWVQVAADRGELAVVPERLGELLALKVPPRQVYQGFNRQFYKVLEHPEALPRMLAVADALSPLLEDDSMRNGLHALMLDGSFVLGDYDRALKLLEGGIADRDADWHAMSTTKVRAHKAMQEGLPDAAIGHLREFMAIIAKSDEASPDPVTGIAHTREMILGRNTVRIGELHADAGRPDEARAAFAEAREHFERALADEHANEQTRALIRQEMAAIPEG